ncbi:MAG: hypothetical protein ABIH65_01070 [Nanoarchaeota archaeon]
MKNKLKKKLRAFDILGNIALVKFDRKTSIKEKKKFAGKIMKNNKSITTVLEKTHKFHGRLRKQQTKYITGKKTKEVLYKENECVFRFNLDNVYFSSRLSNERKEIASLIKKGNVLVMFAGVAPYSIVIAKNSKADKVFSNEINKEANKYAQLNIELNKVKNKVTLLNGDIKKIAKKLKEKFDYIVMPRPQLKESFLKEAFMLGKRGTIIYYYDFCKDSETDLVINNIKYQAKKYKKKIKILKVKKAGEIAPYRFRIRVDFEVL